MSTNHLPAPIIIPIRNPFCGKPKKNINTNTPIELQTECENVEMFYTTDGSKPNVGNIATVSTYGITHKYIRPFRLGPGKQTIRAIANNQYNQSPVVTKVFHVEWVEPPNLGTITHATSKAGFIGKVDACGQPQRPHSAVVSSHVDRATQMKDDCERCPYCFTSKAIDSFVGFCYRCGAKLFVSRTCDASKRVVHPPTRKHDSAAAAAALNGNTLGDVWIDGREWDMAIKDNTCTQCARNNCRDSRYCDCCGSRLNRQCTICCSEQNPVNAKFCLQCGSALMDTIQPQTHQFDESLAAAEAVPSAKPEMKNQMTQTVGLYYPSSKEVSEKAKHRHRLANCSPGNGYWRQQIDFINAHLKTYAYNNLQFRDSISQPRIGALLYVRLRQIDSGCLNMFISFKLNDEICNKKND